jgi:membrane-associated phospholipid phosphatase
VTTSSDIRAIWPGALLSVYLAAAAWMLTIGRSRVATIDLALHLALFATVAFATWSSRVPEWLRLWLPLIALPFLYAEMPALIAAAGHSLPRDAYVMEWERALFGGQPAQTWAARWTSPLLSEILHAAYLSYYPIIFSVPAALWLKRRRAQFATATFVLMATFVVCFAAYVIFPVAGPRYFWASAADEVSGPIRAATLWILETGSSRGTAFPSSHVAVAVTQTLLGVRYFGGRAIPLAVLTAGLGLGAVYGGFHYAIDVVAGAALGGIVFAVSRFALARSEIRSRQAKATAPT